MIPYIPLAVIAIAFAAPAAAQPVTEDEEPTAEEQALFELKRQRSLEAKGISLNAAGIVPAPVTGSPVVPSRPQPSWEEQERERALRFNDQFGQGAYEGAVAFSGRCKSADGCNIFAAMKLIDGAYQFVDLTKAVEDGLAPDSGAYRGRHQKIKGEIRSAMEDFRPRPGANPAYEAEFIKVSDPIVKKIFSKEELLQYAERNAASSDSAAFYNYLGQALNGAGPPGRAREAFDQALRRDPDNDDALSGRAEARLNMGDYPGAVRDAVAALKLNPRNARAYAALKFSEGRVPGSGSAEVFAASGASPPAPGGGTGAAGAFSGGAGDPVSFDSLRRSDALVADARRKLSLGDPRAAVELLGKAVELNPRSAEALALSAMARIRTKDYAGALAAAEAGLKLAPNSVPLLDAKANALNYLKDYRGALAAADLALLANPDDAMAHYNRAWALGGLHDREGALASLRSAARLNPQFAPALAAALDLPPEGDILYLFPGEVRGVRPEPAASAPGSGLPSWLLPGAGAAAAVILGALLLVARRGRPAAPPPLSSVRSVPELLAGKFEVGREIGSGGMGVVYEGRDRSLDRAVAVKRMREEIRWDPRERARFVAEAKLVAKLRHPHIVEIHTIVEQEGEVYLIFEHIAGRTLRQMIDEDGKVPFQRARDLFRGVASALDYAHGLGVIHRDLKPANLMVDAEGRVRVMDFGIARLTEEALSRRTGTSRAVGTPLYMAPEQEQGVARSESDAYSMAVCLYELLTGRRPFAGSGTGLLMNKLKSVYDPPSKLDARLPSGLDEVFAKALGPDPDKRYASAGNLLRALENLETTRS